MKLRTIALSLLFLHAVPASFAQGLHIPLPEGIATRISMPQVVVAPDRADWTYTPGQPMTFSISVLYDGQPLSGVEVEYRIGPERFEAAPVRAVLPEGRLSLAGHSLEVPGFLRCEVRATIQGRTYTGMATAAFAPLEIQPTQSEPEDFDAFWEAQLALLKDLPLGLARTLLPERCTPEVNVYAVRYLSAGAGGPVPFYGILTEPVQPGNYPAVLRVPGAGVRGYDGMVALSANGVIALEIGIHGIPVNSDGSIYDDLRNGALNGYNTYHLDHPERYYYHRVYLGCVRALDVLTSHPMWDQQHLVVVGGSQGGQLSMTTSALDPRVTGTVANYPAYCDVTGYLHGRAGGWPHLFRTAAQQAPEKIATSGYYDVVNFAKRLRAPVSMAFGYNDVTCPPTSMFAAYNVIPAEKELHLQLGMGHQASSEFNDLFTRRILHLIGRP
jgi:cephalosporin-C deacetylase-like acetyl esterase